MDIGIHPSYFSSSETKLFKTETELLVGFYKVGSGEPSMNWSQSVDQALCFGWIDGVIFKLSINCF